MYSYMLVSLNFAILVGIKGLQEVKLKKMIRKQIKPLIKFRSLGIFGEFHI